MNGRSGRKRLFVHVDSVQNPYNYSREPSTNVLDVKGFKTRFNAVHNLTLNNTKFGLNCFADKSYHFLRHTENRRILNSLISLKLLSTFIRQLLVTQKIGQTCIALM